MYFSISTIAAVAAFLASQADAVAIEERSTSLCNQPHYGAVGYPWQSNSSPGSFCSKSKPSNSGAWNNIVSRGPKP